MSFEEFESQIAARSQAQELTPATVAERARRPFAEAWVGEIYPAWAGPLTKAKRVASVVRVGCANLVQLDERVVGNLNELLAKLGRNDWMFVANVFVETAVGVGASVLYAFAGTPKAGALARVPVTDDGGRRVADLANAETWAGSLERLQQAAEDDVEEGAALLGAALLSSLKAKDAREVQEAADRKKAEEDAGRAQLEAAREAAASAAVLARAAAETQQAKADELEAAEKRAAELGVTPEQ